MRRQNKNPVGRRVCAGPDPWLPWPLSRSRWWTRPIRAERLAALRIGLAAVLLIDVLITYLPAIGDITGPNKLASSSFFEVRKGADRWDWSVLRSVSDMRLMHAIACLWSIAAVSLLCGFWSRVSAAVAWFFAVSFFNFNPDFHDGGDLVKIFVLFYLFLTPCGAVWSIDHWRRRRGQPSPRPVYVAPWPLRLLFLQLMVIYLDAGVAKIRDSAWQDGSAMHYVFNNVYWSLSSVPASILSPALLRMLTWVVATWEVAFSFLVMIPLTRPMTLWMGVCFHLALLATMRLGLFPFYMLCLYLPLVPWEHVTSLRRRRIDTGSVDGGKRHCRPNGDDELK